MSARGILLMAGLSAAVGAADGPRGPSPGAPYPVSVLPALDDGSPLSIAHFRGKKVLLLQFASW